MQRIIGRFKSEWILLVTTIVYAVSIFVFFPFLRFYIDNPDTISYISIGVKYADADFTNAINGYWSPLISWILALFFKVGGGEIITFKLLQILIGWFALFNFVKLVTAIVHSTSLQIFLSLACIPFVTDYSLLHLTPDLLFLSVILLYLRLTSEKEFFNHRHFGLIAGVLGILLYFSKSFGFCFFLLHFSVLFLRNYFYTKEYAFKRHLRKNYLQAILCFACISSIWIYLISDKYGHFTISENVSYNLSREVAAAPGKENKLPVLSGGIYQPVNITAVNAWEDPGLATTITPLHPFSSSSDFNVYMQVLKRNLLSIYYSDFRRQLGLLFLILLVVFLFFGKRKRVLPDDYFFSLFIALLFVYGGYALILVHSRYIWVCTLLVLLLSTWILEELLSKNKTQQTIAKILFAIIVIGLAVKRPVKEILFSKDADTDATTLFNSVLHPLKTMRTNYSNDRNMFEARKEMKAFIHPGSVIISIKSPNGNRDGYTQASLFALVSKSKYLGQISENDSILTEQTGKFRIDNLVRFSNEQGVIDSSHWKLIFNNVTLPLEIYSHKN